MKRVVVLRIRRTQGWRDYTVEVAEDAYVLDALQAAQRQDPSLVFRHACHHASCGTCGMRINHQEKLACTTTIREASAGRKGLLARTGLLSRSDVLGRAAPARILLEPLRNFPLIADLAVDTSGLLEKMEQVDRALLREDEVGTDFLPLEEGQPGRFMRYENCIECGLCVSACPIAATSDRYLGPAALAAAERTAASAVSAAKAASAARAAAGAEAAALRGAKSGSLHALVDSAQGLWRCHSAFECSAVCPSDVAPGEAIMRLRRMIMTRRI